MRGPFLPIYGCGAILSLFVTMPFRDNYVLMYFAVAISATILEYITGVVMEKIFKVRYWDYSYKKIQFKGLTGRAVIAGHSCLLLKPHTFMNASGESVVAAMNFYKIPIEKVIVLYDDISLEPGKLRIRRKGSDGGHNGIKSILYLTGKDAFPRVKIGVGAKPHPQYDLAAWVLSHFKKEEMEQLKTALDRCPEIIRLIVDGKMDLAMNRHNS